MCLTFDISEKGRKRLALLSAAFSGSLTIFGIFLSVFAAYIKRTIDDKLHLIANYDAEVLPSFLLTVGIIVLVTNLILTKVCYDLAYPIPRVRWQNLLILLILYLLVAIWFIFAASMMCFSHRSLIEEGLGAGISSMMNNYHHKKEAKVTLDLLQLEYQCCGSKDYNDWINIHWINHAYVNVKHQDIERFVQLSFLPTVLSKINTALTSGLMSLRLTL